MSGPVLFVTWAGGGNVNPMLALAPRLAAHGVPVAAYGPPSLAPRFAAVGVPYGARDTADEWDPVTLATDVRAECARAGAAVAVVDYMLPAALVGTEAAGVTTVALVHTLYGSLLDGSGAPGPMGTFAPIAGLREARSSLGLGPMDGLADLLGGCARVLVTCTPAFDERPEAWAANVRHVGPVLEPAGSDAGWTPPPGDDPLVVVSLGTTSMGEEVVLQALLDALAGDPVRVLAQVGDHVDRAGLTAPANATVAGYVRHAAVLPHAAVAVNHGGLGSVQAAAAHGVPQVCVPQGREQPDNARAVDRAGVGIGLPLGAGGEDGRDAVRSVLADTTYGEAARALAATIDRAAAEREVLGLL